MGQFKANSRSIRTDRERFGRCRRKLSRPAQRISITSHMGYAMRFECFADLCDRWTVWDNVSDIPAEFAAVTLLGLSESEAHALTMCLNRTCGSDALSLVVTPPSLAVPRLLP